MVTKQIKSELDLQQNHLDQLKQLQTVPMTGADEFLPLLPTVDLTPELLSLGSSFQTVPHSYCLAEGLPL